MDSFIAVLFDRQGDPGADASGQLDISRFVTSLEYEDGVPQNCTLTLNAKEGRFLTQSPIIRKWDQIYVEITDRNGAVTKDVFHVKIRRKSGDKTGRKLILQCPHESSNLWTRTISIPARRESGYDALRQIVEELNNSKGDSDPSVHIIIPFDVGEKNGNMLDQNTANDYIFESVKLQSALDEIARIELNPVEGGGSNEPVFIRFKSLYRHDVKGNRGRVALQAFPQGYTDNGGVFNNTPKVTLQNKITATPNLLSYNTNLDTQQGTNLIAIAGKKAGSFPTDFSKYFGAKEVFYSAKAWLAGRTYNSGNLVVHEGTTYECRRRHDATSANQPPDGFNWRSRVFEQPDAWVSGHVYNRDEIVQHNGIAYKVTVDHTANNSRAPPNTRFVRISYAPTTEYSPLTKFRAQSWINALGGGRHARQLLPSGHAATTMVDPNVIIKDANFPRTWVDRVTHNPDNIPAEEKLDGDKFVNTYRVLAVSPVTGEERGVGELAGNDKFGVPYAGNVVEFVDPDGDGVGEWIVFQRTIDDGGVYEWNENNSWVKHPYTGGFQLGKTHHGLGSRDPNWRLGTFQQSEVTFFQGFYTIFTPDGFRAALSGDFSGFGGQVYTTFRPDISFDCAHPVAWDVDKGHIKCGNEGIAPEDDVDRSAVFIESEADGTLTGGPSILTTYLSGFTKYIGLNFAFPWPRTSNGVPYGSVPIGESIRTAPFDFKNMDYNRLHKRDWFGPDVEDYYPVQSFGFIQRLVADSIFLASNPELGEDYEMGIWLADRKDNVVILNYTHSQNATTVPQDVSVGDKEFYFAVPGTSFILSAPEPEVFSVFDDSQVVRGGIYTKDSFDGQGRFLGQRGRYNLISRLKLSIDAFRMTKPLVATNVDEPGAKPDRNIEPQKINVENLKHYAQIKNYVIGLARYYNFVRDSYTILTSGRCNIDFGDPIYLELPVAIDENTNTLQNTVRVAVEKITYSISKPKNGPGGFRRTVHAATRLYV